MPSLPYATLEIDLAAIRANYRLLKARHANHPLPPSSRPMPMG